MGVKSSGNNENGWDCEEGGGVQERSAGEGVQLGRSGTLKPEHGYVLLIQGWGSMSENCIPASHDALKLLGGLLSMLQALHKWKPALTVGASGETLIKRHTQQVNK